MAHDVITLTHTQWFAAPPAWVYQVFVDPKLHAEVTGAGASGPDHPEVGDEFTAWDGYIHATFRTLEPGKRLVQDWQTTAWPADADPSVFELTFTANNGGTDVHMEHSHVPADQAPDYDQGWHDYYWEPMKAYLTNHPQTKH